VQARSLRSTTPMTAKKKPAKKSSARIKPDRIATALQTANGNISVAAKIIGVSRNVIYQHVKKSADLQQILTDSREAIIDYAENALLQAVAEKQGWAVCFTLKTLGRSRGYVEQVDQQHSGHLEIVVKRERKTQTN